MVTGGAGILVLMLLLGFLQLLLGKSVVSPVRRLAGGIERVREGEHATRVTVEGAEELRFLAEGFNEMTATVGAQNRRLEHLAATDHLTGVANHRSFHDALGHALAVAEREPTLAIVVLDLDHFKSLNDAHGHAYGDEVLRLVGARLREAVRDTDLVGRVGGEEFALLLPGAGAELAEEVADRARGRGGDRPAGSGDRLLRRRGGLSRRHSEGRELLPSPIPRFTWPSTPDAARPAGSTSARSRFSRPIGAGGVQKCCPNPSGSVPVFQPIVSLADGRSWATRR